LSFSWQPTGHVQQLNELQVHKRVAFYRKMLDMPQSLRQICLLDETLVVLGSDRRWLWYRPGEGGLSACIEMQNLSPSLMIFEVIGPGFKSELLFVERQTQIKIASTLWFQYAIFRLFVDLCWFRDLL
jgi:hypothetical protein